MAKFNWSPWIAAMTQARQERPSESVGHPGCRLPGRGGQYAWHPCLDMYESAAGVTISVELPGLSREDISLEIEGRGLIVSGERRPEKEPGDGVFHMLERSHGRFARRVDLPEGLDLSATRAVLRDGVLTVSVPRAPSGGSRRIQVED